MTGSPLIGSLRRLPVSMSPERLTEFLLNVMDISECQLSDKFLRAAINIPDINNPVISLAYTLNSLNTAVIPVVAAVTSISEKTLDMRKFPLAM